MVGIGNLEDLLEFVLIDEECVEILKQSIDGGELTRNINKKKSYTSQAYRCPLSKKILQ